MKSLFDYEIKEYDMVELIANVFRKGKIGIIYGESGVGKTISTIKALNAANEKPILLDFDDNDSPESNNCEYIHIDGLKIIDNGKLNLKIEYPKSRIYIVDTWKSFNSNFGNENDAMLALEQLIDLTGSTIIIIDHNVDIASKQDIPMMDGSLVNHLGFKLWLRVGKDKEKCRNVLEIKKLRGYSGNKSIKDWMIDDEMDKLLN